MDRQGEGVLSQTGERESESARPGNSSSQIPVPDDTILVCRLHFPQRRKNKQAALVETGVHAGRSLVKLAGIRNMTWHRLRHDAFRPSSPCTSPNDPLGGRGLRLSWLLFSSSGGPCSAEPQVSPARQGGHALILSISTPTPSGTESGPSE